MTKKKQKKIAEVPPSIADLSAKIRIFYFSVNHKVPFCEVCQGQIHGVSMLGTLCIWLWHTF